jgi:hypothetical protein
MARAVSREDTDMRFMGHNALAILAAAIAIYAIGFVVYGLLIPGEQYMQMAGITAEEVEAAQWKMPLGVIMPILIAIGLSLVIKWRNASGWMSGATTGFWMALFFLFAERLYGFVYTAEGGELLMVDTAHAFVTAIVAGAILGAWK